MNLFANKKNFKKSSFYFENYAKIIAIMRFKIYLSRYFIRHPMKNKFGYNKKFSIMVLFFNSKDKKIRQYYSVLFFCTFIYLEMKSFRQFLLNNKK